MPCLLVLQCIRVTAAKGEKANIFVSMASVSCVNIFSEATDSSLVQSENSEKKSAIILQDFFSYVCRTQNLHAFHFLSHEKGPNKRKHVQLECSARKAQSFHRIPRGYQATCWPQLQVTVAASTDSTLGLRYMLCKSTTGTVTRCTSSSSSSRSTSSLQCNYQDSSTDSTSSGNSSQCQGWVAPAT